MRIRIENFQPFADTTFDVAGLTVVLGPSNRGKSALVRAIEGALFNRPGDGCIRSGAKSAQVTIDGLPGPKQVVWTKARSTTYTLDGETYGKLSGDTPPALQEAGFRDLWIGDRDRKKGEYLRPQVAGQFDPLFLLTRSGSFVADVLNLVTRQAVLTTAQDRCAGDLRSVVQRHGTLEAERVEAVARVEALAEVPSLVARLESLQAQDTALTQLRAGVERLRDALHRRSVWRGLGGATALALQTPAAEPVLGRLLSQHALRDRLQARLQLGRVAGLLPPPSSAATLAVTIERRARVAQLSALRAGVGSLPVLPSAVTYPAPLDAAIQLRDRVRRLVTAQRNTLQTLRQREAAAEGASQEVSMLEAQLHDQLGALDVCPLCEQVITHEPTAQPS